MTNKFAKKLAQSTNSTKKDKVVVLSSEQAQPDAFDFDDKNTLIELRCDQLKRDPTQPRLFFSEKELLELLKSIETNGQIQTVLVGPKDPVDNLYPIIVGERRWRAISLSKNNLKIFAIKLSSKNKPDDLKKKMIQLAENKERVNINVVEEAISYKSVADMCSERNMSQTETANSLQISRTKLVKYLAVADCNIIIDSAKEKNVINDLESLYLLSTIIKKNPSLPQDEIDKYLIQSNGRDESVRKEVKELKKNLVQDNKDESNYQTRSVKPKKIDSLIAIENIEEQNLILDIEINSKKNKFILNKEQIKYLKNILNLFACEQSG